MVELDQHSWCQTDVDFVPYIVSSFVTVPAISTRIKVNLLEFDADGFVQKNQF